MSWLRWDIENLLEVKNFPRDKVLETLCQNKFGKSHWNKQMIASFYSNASLNCIPVNIHSRRQNKTETKLHTTPCQKTIPWIWSDSRKIANLQVSVTVKGKRSVRLTVNYCCWVVADILKNSRWSGWVTAWVWIDDFSTSMAPLCALASLSYPVSSLFIFPFNSSCSVIYLTIKISINIWLLLVCDGILV